MSTQDHGGGRPGPPIAGDPHSFPSDAELARTLAAAQRRATLCTLTAKGYPYGSAVSYAVDGDGAPLVLISELAEHTINARADNRVSLLVSDNVPEGTDPLAVARMTLVGRLQRLAEPGAARDRYLERHPQARFYADFTDFAFWHLEVEECRYVGGFGHMSWVDAAAYAAAEVDPLGPVAAGIVAHMNDDHAEANLAYARVLARLDDATAATMVGVDRYGVTLQVDTPSGPRLARVAFAEALTSAEQARPAIIALLDRTRF